MLFQPDIKNLEGQGNRTKFIVTAGNKSSAGGEVAERC